MSDHDHDDDGLGEVEAHTAHERLDRLAGSIADRINLLEVRVGALEEQIRISDQRLGLLEETLRQHEIEVS